MKKKSRFKKNRFLKKMQNLIKPMLLPGHPWVPSKNFSQFGPAVWPAIHIDDLFYYLIAWEPCSAAQFTKSCSRRLPSRELFYLKTKFLLFKWTHSTQNLKTQLRTFPQVFQVTQSNFEANPSRASQVMIDKQKTEKKITKKYQNQIQRVQLQT